MTAAAVGTCGKEAKCNVSGCRPAVVPLFTVVQSLVFICTVLTVTAHYAADGFGMITVITVFFLGSCDPEYGICV